MSRRRSTGVCLKLDLDVGISGVISNLLPAVNLALGRNQRSERIGVAGALSAEGVSGHRVIFDQREVNPAKSWQADNVGAVCRMELHAGTS
jgi:hypothetical protein